MAKHVHSLANQEYSSRIGFGLGQASACFGLTCCFYYFVPVKPLANLSSISLLFTNLGQIFLVCCRFIRSGVGVGVKKLPILLFFCYRLLLEFLSSAYCNLTKLVNFLAKSVYFQINSCGKRYQSGSRVLVPELCGWHVYLVITYDCRSFGGCAFDLLRLFENLLSRIFEVFCIG